MKLIQYEKMGAAKAGVELTDGTRIDVSSHFANFDAAFFASQGIQRLQALINGSDASNLPYIDAKARLLSPVHNPAKLVAIGLNYSLHAKESGADIPTEPEVFTKQVSCISGPNDPIWFPPTATKLDYEVELAFVMGEKVSYLKSEKDALKTIAGYLICNDISERAYQMQGKQWTKGKSHDTFGPLGPWLVTSDEVGDPHKLKLTSHVNGEERQNSNTSDLIFDIPHIVWYLSRYMTLYPGDVITTGTPAGVAGGMNDPNAFLKVGDRVTLKIDKLGTQEQEVIAHPYANG